MNRALSLQAQIFISILIGMGFSFMLARSFPPTILSPHPSTPDFLTPTVIPLATFTVAAPATPTSLPMPLETGTPAPYITLPGVWMVRIQFFLDSPPKILKATYLQQGRITPFDQGDYQIEILSAGGDVLFTGNFVINFLQGDPPRAADNVTTILMIPAIDQATQFRLKTPQGETIYDIQP